MKWFSTLGLALLFFLAIGLAQVPHVKAAPALSLDGSGFNCTNGNSNGANIQGKSCPNNGSAINTCQLHSGAFCPISEGPFLVVVDILLNNTAQTVSSVSSNQGMNVWTKRGSVLNGLGGEMEEWYSIDTTAAISNPSIGFTFSATAKFTVAIQVLVIAGINTSSPFDPNIPLPVTNTGTSNTMSATISNADGLDMLVGFSFGGTNGTLTAGTGFTGVCVGVNPCQGNSIFQGVSPDASEYQVTSNPVTNAVVSVSQTGGASWGFIADVVQSLAPINSGSGSGGSGGQLICGYYNTPCSPASNSTTLTPQQQPNWVATLLAWPNYAYFLVVVSGGIAVVVIYRKKP